MPSVYYDVLKSVDEKAVKDIKSLYLDAGWWEDTFDYAGDFIYKMVAGSECFVAAFSEDRLIGMGRALSDGSSDAYIQDVVVLAPYRKSGIGAAIIKKIIKALEKKGVDWIGLIGEPGTGSFYENLGFERMKNYVPLLYKGH